jgi:hypothetical protein
MYYTVGHCIDTFGVTNSLSFKPQNCRILCITRKHISLRAGASDWVWIGLMDEASEGSWVLPSTYQNATFFNWGNWGSAEPNGNLSLKSDEDCTALYHGGGGKWADYPCSWAWSFVCQYR